MARYHVPRITVTLAGVDARLAQAAVEQLPARIAQALQPGGGAEADPADRAGVLATRIARQVAGQCRERLRPHEER